MAKIGRNSPCPCGSGNKFKKCCGSLTPRSPSVPLSEVDSLANASDLEDPHAAAARLGLSYLTATDAPPDFARGVALIKKAAAAGDARGAYLAATISSSSFWQPQDWDAAFDYLMRAAQLGHEPSQSSLRILAGGPSGNKMEGEDWAKFRDMIDLAEWVAPPAVRLIRESPRIQVIEQFAPPAVCDWLIERVRDRLTRATIYDKATGGTTVDGRRTNSHCDLDIESLGVLTFVLRGRIAEITQRPDQAMEVPKVLHYLPGETFAKHFDFLNPDEPTFAAELAQRGQRSNTFLLYLNDDYDGGETHFPRIDISHRGTKGDALLFSNVDAAGNPDQDTMHAGLPTTTGEKWLFSQWIRALPTH